MEYSQYKPNDAYVIVDGGIYEPSDLHVSTSIDNTATASFTLLGGQGAVTDLESFTAIVRRNDAYHVREIDVRMWDVQITPRHDTVNAFDFELRGIIERSEFITVP